MGGSIKGNQVLIRIDCAKVLSYCLCTRSGARIRALDYEHMCALMQNENYLTWFACRLVRHRWNLVPSALRPLNVD